MGENIVIHPEGLPYVAFAEGDEVEARYKGGRYIVAMVTKVDSSSRGMRYDVMYEDGESGESLSSDHVRGVGTRHAMTKMHPMRFCMITIAGISAIVLSIVGLIVLAVIQTS
jgi:hypothetical protein